MRSSRSVALATWMLQNLGDGVGGEALAGDLLEELSVGRSMGWYWRQVFGAVGTKLLATSRIYALPLIFSAGWSMFYPAWLAIARSSLQRALLACPAILNWPYSAFLDLALGVLPAITFVGAGFSTYLFLRRSPLGKITQRNLLRSLSISFNVLLMETLFLLWLAKPHGTNLHLLATGNLYSSFHWTAVSVPLSLSLYSALISLRPYTQKRPSLLV
jgi:hypothetical protein